MPKTEDSKTETKDESPDLSAQEKAAIQLAQAVYGSILDAGLPQDIMEAIGKSIQTEVAWVKLPAKQRLGLFRVAAMLQDRLPKVKIDGGTPEGKEKGKDSASTTDDTAVNSEE